MQKRTCHVSRIDKKCQDAQCTGYCSIEKWGALNCKKNGVLSLKGNGMLLLKVWTLDTKDHIVWTLGTRDQCCSYSTSSEVLTVAQGTREQ